jgi:hypothetical protein
LQANTVTKKSVFLNQLHNGACVHAMIGGHNPMKARHNHEGHAYS